MAALVTLEKYKAARHIYHTDDDADITSAIAAASEAVIDYLDKRAEFHLSLDSGGELVSGATVSERIQRATIAITKYLIEDDEEKIERAGGIPKIAEMLLYRLSDPPLA